MKYRDLERILISSGFQIIRKSKHIIWSDGFKTISVPHTKSINKMLTKHILKSIGLQREKYE